MTRAVIGVPFGTRTGGSELLLLTVLRHREAAGLDVRVLLLEDGPFRAEIEALGVPVEVVGGGRGATALPRAVAQARRSLRRHEPDVVVSWLPRMQLVLGPAAALAGMRDRIVAWQHVIPEAGWRHALCFAMPCRMVVTYSKTAARVQASLWPRRKVEHVWPAIDPPVAHRPEEVDALRVRLGLRPGTPVVGIVGRLIGWKGQVELLEAVALLRDEGQDAQLLVVGGEDPREHDGTLERLQALARERGLEDRLVLAGQVDDATPYFQLMDVAVNASDPEPFGFVLLEAMALDVPVLAVASGGPAEIVEPGVSGVLVASSAPADLADGLRGLLGDPDVARRMAEGGRRRFEEAFSARDAVGQMVRALEHVAGPSGAARAGPG